jgi:UDP-3-O-[3-hydroxymyristoyl] N-acetylglucosamine deacetylase
MRLQRTIKREVSFQGIGLHTGKQATVRLKPAPRDTGIVFYRSDKDAIIRASVHSVIDTAFCTTIGYNGVKIKTIEHLMAAIAGLGIDNLYIDINGPEVPILDGSSTELVGILVGAGIAKLSKNMSYIKITAPVVYEDAHSVISALPYDGRALTYHMSFNHKVIGDQNLSIELDEINFARELAPARTFGFYRDIDKLKANGLAQGGSLDNAVIVGDEGILNPDGLRFDDEFVRHKALDAVGDFALLGMPVEGHIMMERSGHTANSNFLRKLLSCRNSYRVVSAEVDHLSHQVLNYS